MKDAQESDVAALAVRCNTEIALAAIARQAQQPPLAEKSIRMQGVGQMIHWIPALRAFLKWLGWPWSD